MAAGPSRGLLDSAEEDGNPARTVPYCRRLQAPASRCRPLQAAAGLALRCAASARRQGLREIGVEVHSGTAQLGVTALAQQWNWAVAVRILQPSSNSDVVLELAAGSARRLEHGRQRGRNCSALAAETSRENAFFEKCTRAAE